MRHLLLILWLQEQREKEIRLIWQDLLWRNLRWLLFMCLFLANKILYFIIYSIFFSMGI